METRRKLAAVKARLGEPRATAPRKGEYGFICPGKPGGSGCPSARQGKAKLWVNPETERFNCWVCGFHGGNLTFLMVPGSPELREYNESRTRRGAKQIHEPDEKPPCTALPPEFTPFGRSGNHIEAPYISYLKGRGLSEKEIVLYRMGYADTGKLAGRVIVPSFDRFGAVNFWSARTIWPSADPTYRLPFASKDVVSNEHMVNWTDPVYLVEGIFDEVAIGPQAIALYGKFMQPLLARRLVENRPPIVYICLDSDARREALGLMERLVGYDIHCAVVDLPGKDPGSLDFDSVRKAAEAARPVTGSLEMISARGRL